MPVNASIEQLLNYNHHMVGTERTLQTEAIVLRHSDWGEADRLLWLYTRKEGKLRTLAKGVRKIGSRKAGHLEPFTQVALLLARGKDFWIVTQAETVDAFHQIREDLVRVGYAFYIVELLDRFTYEGDENLKLYRLLAESLSRLNSAPDPTVPLRYYEVHLLDLLGYRPQLFQCTRCKNETQPEDQYFSISLGGVLCPKCGPYVSDASPISVDPLRYLRHFQRSSFSAVAGITLPAWVNRQLESFLQHYFTYHLERALNTPEFIQRVRDT